MEVTSSHRKSCCLTTSACILVNGGSELSDAGISETQIKHTAVPSQRLSGVARANSCAPRYGFLVLSDNCGGTQVEQRASLEKEHRGMSNG